MTKCYSCAVNTDTCTYFAVEIIHHSPRKKILFYCNQNRRTFNNNVFAWLVTKETKEVGH
jgi:hypothetical protein